MTKAFRERYPGPWTSRRVRSRVAPNGTVLAYIYFEDDLPTRRAVGKRATRSEAWAMAKAIAGRAG